MTNGEKFLKDYYPNSSITRDSLTGRVFVNEDNADFTLPIEWWDAEYKEPTTKNDLGVDCIDRNSIKYYSGQGGYVYASKGEIDKLPSVTPQPRCRECKWWKDSDGVFRRGIGAESQCPINTHAVYSGEGYCYKFSPKLEQEPVIDKIRAEIEDTGAYEQEVNGKTEFLKGINYCLGIIDKYKSESEDEK